ncbi:MAG TPA: type II toxin-antitoxin system VapC family toxin [Terriglobia bacterium]|nr:type II toxin-antitoxin system VapC family toxin [Terriglobia bacterium]
MIPRVALDTNALSAIADAEPSMARYFKQEGDICLPVIVLGEFRYGILESRRQAAYERWLAELLLSCRILDLTEETAKLYAQLRLQLKENGRPIPSNDLWIAALCLQHSLPLLSRDRHFDYVKGIQRLGW